MPGGRTHAWKGTVTIVSNMDMPAPAMKSLLNQGLLDGQHEVSIVLRPERAVRPVAASDFPAALNEIARVCQVWGGAGHPLLPITDRRYPSPYQRLLDHEQFDYVGGLQDIDVDLPHRVEEQHSLDFPALLVAAHEPRDRWRPVEVCDLAKDDPWRPIYTAVIGTIPDQVDADLIDLHFLREDLTYNEVVPLERVTVTGSLEDLTNRLADHDHLTPRRFANMDLASGMSPDTSYLGRDNPVIPRPNEERRAAGPNIVVAMSPDSVGDLALLWNLRAAHGDARVLPIGIPVDQITASALRHLQEPGRAAMFGLGGGSIRLISTSIDTDHLTALAGTVPGVVVLGYDSLLTWGPAPGRPRSQVTTWTNGRTRLIPLSEGDQDVLRIAVTATRSPELLLDVIVPDAPLPTDPTMRGHRFDARFQAGAAQVAVPYRRRGDTVEVRWTSSWTALAAVTQTRGLQVRESQPGIAARNLIEAVGSIEQTRALAHHGLIALLYRMAEVSGMSWWKQRWASVQRELREAGMTEAESEQAATRAGRDELVVAPPGEGRAVPFQEFVRALDNKGDAAEQWVSWAERRHLLVRGVDIKCDSCGAPTWLPMAAIPPPVICAACGREIVHPYGQRQMRFTYRLGEPIRRVLETDSLGHVLALRWLTGLLEDRALIGAHPGVDFIDPGTGRTIGEADVVLLMRDGSIVPVEVKRRAAGATDDNERLMDTLADAVAAPWNVLVVTEPARDCPDLPTRERRLPDRPRLLLTTDQLYNEYTIWAMGGDPFGWEPYTEDRDRERARKFADGLARTTPDHEHDWVSETLLDPSRSAYRRRASNDIAADSYPAKETGGVAEKNDN